MASKSAQQEPEKAEVIEEALDAVDTTLDRLKVLYEQYFLGIQKQPPQFLHGEVERQLRDLAQLQIRNTALRYRFATLQQKFGSYHTYWRRTLREIEAGRYHRSLSKVTRQAAATGAEIPYEILATMPRRMREQVRRDREAAVALHRYREGVAGDAEPGRPAPPDDEDAGFVRESTDVRMQALQAHGLHVLEEADADADVEALYREAEGEDETMVRAPAIPREPAEQAPAPGVRYPDFIARRSAAKPPPPAATAAKPPPPAATAAKPPPPPPPAAAKPPPAMAGPFPRDARSTPPSGASSPSTSPSRSTPPSGASIPPPPPPSMPPPGMTEADVNALYAKYVKAKEMVGQKTSPGSFGKLMRTIHAQAPKIMEQYQARGVDFSVVIKDDQVIIRAKPRM